MLKNWLKIVMNNHHKIIHISQKSFSWPGDNFFWAEKLCVWCVCMCVCVGGRGAGEEVGWFILNGIMPRWRWSFINDKCIFQSSEHWKSSLGLLKVKPWLFYKTMKRFILKVNSTDLESCVIFQFPLCWFCPEVLIYYSKS